MITTNASSTFSVQEESEALLTSLFQSLCRSDQDDWLRKNGLARQYQVDADQQQQIPGTPLKDGSPTRGLTNIAAILHGVGHSNQFNKNEKKQEKYEVSCNSRVSHALRLTGEDQTPSDETAKPRLFNITFEGPKSRILSNGKRGEMSEWFEDLTQEEAQQQQQQQQQGIVKKQEGDGSEEENAEGEGENVAAAPPAEFLSIVAARKEYLDQEHFGLPFPQKNFDAAVEKFPSAMKRGSLNFDEFFSIFSKFEYS